MKAETILFLTDFSPGADAALQCAEELAKSLGALLSILHVELAPELKAPYDDEDDPQEHREHDLLDKVKPNDEAVRFERTFLKGNIAESILRFARKKAVDVIVMGTHGQTNSPDAVLGTVAEAVTAQAPSLVIAVKPAAAKSELAAK